MQTMLYDINNQFIIDMSTDGLSVKL